MTTIVVKANISLLDAEDTRAMKFVASMENQRREGDGLPLLDISDRLAIKEHYETHIASCLMSIHSNYVSQALRSVDTDPTFRALRSQWSEATPAQREASRQALIGGV